MIRILAVSLLGMSLFAAEPARQQPRLATTEHFDFAPGGTVKIEGSFDCLSVEGWDRPEVEVVVTRYSTRFGTPQERDRTAKELETIKVKSERRSDTELAISTQLPKRGRWSSFRSGVGMEYTIRVPRDSHLTIRHGSGSVIISGVSGEIEATSKVGDIVAMLPDPGPYAIDAKTKVGTVYSDFGDPVHRLLIGEHFTSAKPDPARRVYLRTGFGGISIQEIRPGGY